MNILLTGANSFIGRNLGAFLHEKGYALMGTVRKNKHESFKPPWLNESFILDLSEPENADDSIFEHANVVIHLVHDFSPGAIEKNIEATIFLAEKGANAGVGRQVYFSSYSSRPDAVSEYGVVKHRLEQYFLMNGHIIVRPGLVIGNGGMFLKLFEAIRKFPVIPLIDGGKGEVPIISIGQLCEVLTGIISSALPESEYNIFYPEMTTMRALTEVMKSVANSKAVLAPIPLGIVVLAANFSNLLGIRLPFDAGSAKSYRKNQERIYESNIAAFLDKYDSVFDAVKAVSLNMRSIG
jgi:nucleoside-diphosphate-sugar epimerase